MRQGKKPDLKQLRKQREQSKEAGRQLVGRGRWQDAFRHYDAALASQRELYERALLQSEKFRVLAEDRSLYGEAAYVAACAGDALAAAMILETARAQILGEAWVRDQLFPSLLDEADAQLAAEHRRAAARLAALERRERDIIREAGPDDDTKLSLKRLKGEVRAARAEMERVLKAAERFVNYGDFCTAQTLAHFEACVKEGSALVYVSTTVFGSYAAVVAPTASGEGSRFGVCWMDEFKQFDLLSPVGVLATDSDSLIMWTAGSTLRAANALSQLDKGGAGWLDLLVQLENVLRYVGQKLVAPLAAFLSEHGLVDIALVPCGDLAQVPLQIAPFTEQGREVTLVDRFDLRLAPSARVLEMCRRAAARGGEGRGACTVVQSPDLPGMAYEAKFLESLWPRGKFRLMAGPGFDREELRAGLRGAVHIVLSCHGYFRYWHQLSSAFVVGERVILDLRDMLNEQWLLGCRLVIAPACMSGFEDSSTTLDECISLSLGLFCTGAAAVVGSQWNVEDFVGAVFVTRFHRELLAEDANGLPHKPWATFSRVQRWLKNVSVEELTSYVESVPTLDTLHREYVEEFGPEALTGIFASPAKRSEEFKRLAQGAPEQARISASRRGDTGGASMRSWFWGAFVYAGA